MQGYFSDLIRHIPIVSLSVSSGLGWGMTIVTAIMTVYFNVIISWILYYLGHSFYGTLPWATCDNAWNTPGCLERRSRSKEVDFSASVANSNSSQFYSNTSQQYSNVTEMLIGVTTPENSTTEVTADPSLVIVGNETFVRRTPAEEFWEWVVHDLNIHVHECFIILTPLYSGRYG